MKKTILLMLGFMFVAVNLYASDWDELRSYAKQKDYVQAEKYIDGAIKERYKDEDVYMLAGKVYTELDDYNKALLMYEKAYDLEDDDPVIISKLALAYSRLKQYDKALELLNDAVKDYPDDLHILLALGSVDIAKGDLDQAALQITKARENNKNNPEPYVALGDLYFAQKIYELAKNNYEEALKIDETLTDARIKLATAYYWMANREYDKDLSNELFNRSLKEWNIITKKAPKYARAWWEQGRILFYGKRFDLAAGSFQKYLELRPDHSLARWYLAQSYVETGYCDSAVTHLRQVAAEIDSVKYKAGLKLAQCLFQQERFGEALKEYETVKPHLKLAIKDIERMAAASLKMADTTKTINYYKEVIKLDPTKCNLMYQLANLTIFMKDYTNAIFFLDTRNKNCKDSMQSKVYYLLGTSYFSLDSADTAAVLLRKAVELDSTNLQARIYMADVMASLDEKDEAKAEFEKSLAIALADTAKYKREITQAYAKLCNMLLEMKQFKEMNSVTKKWLDYDSKSAYAWIYHGISWQGMGDKENACRAYKKGLKYNPKNGFLNKQVKKLQCN
jgi:tetratricopeptide (TPR) repeat protein